MTVETCGFPAYFSQHDRQEKNRLLGIAGYFGFPSFSRSDAVSPGFPSIIFGLRSGRTLPHLFRQPHPDAASELAVLFRQDAGLPTGLRGAGVARGEAFGCPVRMQPRLIGGLPAALQSRQKAFIVRLKASAARRFPSGVWRPLPGADPCNRQRFLGLPSSSAAHIIKQGNPVDRACAKHLGHQLLRVPTIESSP